jgi:hypothetical protein
LDFTAATVRAKLSTSLTHVSSTPARAHGSAGSGAVPRARGDDILGLRLFDDDFMVPR